MKVDNERQPRAAESKRDFKQTLKALPVKAQLKPVAKALPRASPPSVFGKPLVLSEARAAAHRVADGLTHARAGMEAKVAVAHEVRTESVSGGEQKFERKALALIAAHLNDASNEPGGGTPEQPLAQVVHFQRQLNGAAPAKSESAANVDGIMALVERIRVFEKAGRPAMSVTVGGSLNAEVEIERAGPKLVSLKIVGKLKSPSVSGLNEIREELLKRGIKVAALSISSR